MTLAWLAITLSSQNLISYLPHRAGITPISVIPISIIAWDKANMTQKLAPSSNVTITEPCRGQPEIRTEAISGRYKTPVCHRGDSHKDGCRARPGMEKQKMYYSILSLLLDQQMSYYSVSTSLTKLVFYHFHKDLMFYNQ